MTDLVVRWPFWYVALVGYCLYLGVAAIREFARATPDMARAREAATTPHARGHLAGYRASQVTRAVFWVLGAAGLLAGWAWVRPVLAIGMLLPVRRIFRDYATGFAVGRKAGELAAAPEYVQGRTAPDSIALTASAAYVTLTRLLPLAGLVYSALTL